MGYLSYIPHSGFGNQMIPLRNAINIASTFNLTLVTPLLLEHFDTIGLGHCGGKIVTHKDLEISYNQVKKKERYNLDDIFDISIPTSLVSECKSNPQN
jgi:hypothetical protein